MRARCEFVKTAAIVGSKVRDKAVIERPGGHPSGVECQCRAMGLRNEKWTSVASGGGDTMPLRGYTFSASHAVAARTSNCPEVKRTQKNFIASISKKKDEA